MYELKGALLLYIWLLLRSHIYSSSACVCVSVRAYVCVCTRVRACVRNPRKLARKSAESEFVLLTRYFNIKPHLLKQRGAGIQRDQSIKSNAQYKNGPKGTQQVTHNKSIILNQCRKKMGKHNNNADTAGWLFV